MITRRSMLLGIGAALAAPAIVRAESLMKIIPPPRSVFNAAELLKVMDELGRVAMDEGWMKTGTFWSHVYFSTEQGKIISETIERRLPFTIMPEMHTNG